MMLRFCSFLKVLSMRDCWARSVAGGAAWTLFVDLDEFLVVPSGWTKASRFANLSSIRSRLRLPSPVLHRPDAWHVLFEIIMLQLRERCPLQGDEPGPVFAYGFGPPKVRAESHTTVSIRSGGLAQSASTPGLHPWGPVGDHAVD